MLSSCEESLENKSIGNPNVMKGKLNCDSCRSTSRQRLGKATQLGPFLGPAAPPSRWRLGTSVFCPWPLCLGALSTLQSDPSTLSQSADRHIALLNFSIEAGILLSGNGSVKLQCLTRATCTHTYSQKHQNLQATCTHTSGSRRTSRHYGSSSQHSFPPFHRCVETQVTK